MFKTIEQLKNKEKGFSLLELSVAVGIAAIVAAVAITATTGFVNGAAGSAELYEAGADQSIVDASDSFDALGQLDPNRERGGVTGLNNAGGGNGGNNDSTPPENNEPESPFPIAFNITLTPNNYWGGTFYFKPSDKGLSSSDLQLMFDNVEVGHYIAFESEIGEEWFGYIDPESMFIFDMDDGWLYVWNADPSTQPTPDNTFAGANVVKMTLLGSDNPLG